MEPDNTSRRNGENWRQPANPQNPDRSFRLHPYMRTDSDRRDDRLNSRRPNFEKQPSNRRKFEVGFMILEEWSQKDPDAVVVEIIAKVGEFQELLESEKIQESDHGDYIVLIAIILAKACQSPFKENKHQIMGLASTEQFINSLTNYIITLQLQEEEDKRWCKKFWKNPEDFFRNLVVIFETILETVPTRACQILPRLLKGTLCTITALNAGLENVHGEFMKLQKKLHLSKAEIERKKTKPNHEVVEEAYPEDFRTLSVYPTSQDILSDQRPFIQKHIIEGCYEDVDHYLDVQFRLCQPANPQNPDANRPPFISYGVQNGAIPRQNFHGDLNAPGDQPRQNETFGIPHFDRRRPNFDSRDNRLNSRRPNFEKKLQNNEPKFEVGFKILEDWTQKDPDAVVVEIIAKVGEFQELLESEKIQNSDHRDYIVIIVIILAKACQSPFKERKHQITGLASTEQFINSLTTYIMTLQLQEEEDKRWCKMFWKNPEDFFRNLVIIFESILETLPTKACQILPRLLKGTLCVITALNAGLEDVHGEFLKLQKQLDLSKTEIEQKKTRPKHQYVEEAPPDDFRTLSVYPTSQDILGDQRLFIRKHIIEGCYDNVDHYLDVQFRLLKEDFVGPLREGVRQVLDQEGQRKRVANVRVHRHVEFRYPTFSQGEVGVVLQFDCRTMREFSKRFMYGSLLCFTKDGFMTILFGKVVERDNKMLEEGQVVVGFEPGYDNYEANTPYVMIECSVYFEPYYHVLRALQNMHEDGFPMKNYLIDVNPAIEPPKYLSHRSRYTIESSNSSYSVPVLEFTQWLSAADLNLNSTQRDAFWAALTQQFAVIQGPPGTGKTFLGLKIARTLIQNRVYWYDDTPILVVCYTNHALDQFLEGLIDTTNKIVRVGGQSKNPKLEKFHLKKKRKDFHSRRNNLYNLRYTLREELSGIYSISESVDEISRYDSILHFKHFTSIADYDASWFAKASEQALLGWLLGGRTRQQRPQELLVRKMQKLEQGNGNTAAATAGQDDNIEFDQMLNEERRARNEIDEDDLLDVIVARNYKPVLLTSIKAMNRRIEEILTELQKLSGELHERAIFDKRWDLERELYETEDDLEYLKMRLFNGQNVQVTRKPHDIDFRNPQNMHPDDRWNLYFFWLNRYRQTLIDRLMKLQTRYRNNYRRYKEIKDLDDANIMKNMLVVGMTTTGAARLQTTLQAIKSPIVIVEEAAEVLESHIIVSLTEHCKHLILIGDHKQLKPSTANYQMEKQFNLGISLFERMVRNKIQCHVLGVQHRMRPEIARLIVPSVYRTLENHPSVSNFPAVMGVDPCMYFIDHNEPELAINDFSKMNQHEAEFLIRLARYLVQNGYEPKDITILAAYSGQMFALWREHKKYDLLRDVRVTVLDNYQGEESKIILLSLVRNNDADSIGFLSIENRVCVALSRAKEGFYMMGNMDLLSGNSEIWPKVKTALQEQDFLGDSLALRCQIHREEVTRVKTIKDFDKVPEGGCSKECDSTLNCGHKCPKICHTLDREHAKVKCKAPCIRILCNNNHLCPKLCFIPCEECVVPMKQTLTCGHEQHVPCYMDVKDFKCRVQVTAILPCEHVVTNKFCFIKEENFMCPWPCDTQIEPCGHQCVYTCHIKDDPDHLNYKCRKECARPRPGCSTGEHICPSRCFEECISCEVIVKKRGKKCNHMFDVRCSVDVDTVQCPQPCKKGLPCGHFCKKKCYEPCDSCQEMVDKEHPVCGHKVRSKCSEPADRKNCSGPCLLLLQCGHPCKNKCNELCTEKCKELVDHNKSADCGHKFKISCHLQNQDIPSNSNELLNFCTEPCRTQLSCDHYCKGTCGQCFQGRLHQTCKEKCPVVLICGHPCPITCREACQPCNRPCSYRCSHSKCKKLCGEPCTSCEQPCLRRCQHVQCKNICGEVCSVPPCTEPCQKPLKKCGHPCVGFCGDPCPPLCRICDEKELTEVFRGFEDKEDARFVYLQECKHVIESKSMDAWLQKDESEITYKSCPKCKTPLTSTQRYSDYIKKANIDVSKVKSKYYGNDEQNENKRRQLVEKMHKLRSASEDLMEDSFYMRKFLSNCLQSLLPANRQRRQHLSSTVADVYEIKLQIVEQMVETLNDVKNKMSESADSNTIFVLSDADLRTEQMEYLNTAIKHFKINLKFLLQNEQRITNQEIADLAREQNRLQRITQLCHLQSSPTLRTQQHKPEVKALVEECNKLVHAASIYTDDQDAAVKEKLVKLSETVKAGIDIADAQKSEIVRAINMGAGHWYKCPNGHMYTIGDCDGAEQIGKCNECEVQIGGTSHSIDC